MSISTSDANTFGATLEATGRALGALLTFGGVVVLMYTSAPELATLVLVVSPLMLAASTPALLPLNAAQLAERTQNSRLTSLATDIPGRVPDLEVEAAAGENGGEVQLPVEETLGLSHIPDDGEPLVLQIGRAHV